MVIMNVTCLIQEQEILDLPHQVSMFPWVYLNRFRPEETNIYREIFRQLVKILYEIRIITLTIHLHLLLLPHQSTFIKHHPTVAAIQRVQGLQEDLAWKLEAAHCHEEEVEQNYGRLRKCLPSKDWVLKCLKRGRHRRHFQQLICNAISTVTHINMRHEVFCSFRIDSSEAVTSKIVCPHCQFKTSTWAVSSQFIFQSNEKNFNDFFYYFSRIINDTGRDLLI